MATYGVTYAGAKQPRGYGVAGSHALASMFGSQSMQPMSSAQPQFRSLAASTTAPLDALSRVMQNGQDTFAKIAPAASNPASFLPPTLPAGTTQASVIPGLGSASPAPSSYQGTDLSADPILTQIKDLGRRSTQDAAQAGMAGAKNDLINYGSVDVPQQLKDLFAAETPTTDSILGNLPTNPVLGALNDTGTGTAAAANPFSTTKQLAHAHETNQHQIDQTANLANLYYSSTHANQLGDENNAYLGSQNSALQALAQALSGENGGLLSAINGAHDQYLGELPNAYNRALAAGGSGAPADTTQTTTTAPPPPTTDTSLKQSGFAFTPQTNPFNPLLAALAGANPGARQSLLNRYAG